MHLVCVIRDFTEFFFTSKKHVTVHLPWEGDHTYHFDITVWLKMAKMVNFVLYSLSQ